MTAICGLIRDGFYTSFNETSRNSKAESKWFAVVFCKINVFPSLTAGAVQTEIVARYFLVMFLP